MLVREFAQFDQGVCCSLMEYIGSKFIAKELSGILYFQKRQLCPNWSYLPSGKVSKKGKRKVQGVPQSQTAALPRPQEEEETNKSKQAQIKQTYEKH